MNRSLIEGSTRICNVRTCRSEINFSTQIGQPKRVVRFSNSIAHHDVKDAFFNGFQEVATSKSRRSFEAKSFTRNVPKKRGNREES
jgi:hypothetical protein